MPMKNRHLYPDDWEEISREICFERAQGRCEAPGCGAPHGKLIARSSKDPERYIIFDDLELEYRKPNGEPIRDSELPEEFLSRDFIRVILTTHHLGVDKPDGTPGDKEDKMDCRPENLMALCQLHHLAADREGNIQKSRVTRRETRRRKIREAGQTEFVVEE